MSKLRLFGILVVLAVLFSSANLALAQVAMTNYCITPPFVSTTIAPNILLILSTGPTTGRRAYQNPLAGHTSAAFDPSASYFGYFDSNSWYTYSGGNNGTFSLAATGSRPNTSTYSGNFLNWISMRRMDLMTATLIGGKAVGNRTTRDLPAEVIGTCTAGDYDGTSASTMDPVACSGTGPGCRTFTGATICNYVNNTAFANICSATNVTVELQPNSPCNSTKPSIVHMTDGTNSLDLNIDINYATGDPQPSGVILDNEFVARWGIETLNPTAGGFIPNSVSIIGPCSRNFFTGNGQGSPGVDGGALDVNSTGGNPIAEAVWTGFGYYSQGLNPTSSADLGNGTGTITNGANGPDYAGQTGSCSGQSCIKGQQDPYDYTKDVDPVNLSCNNQANEGFPPCAKSFILLLTDGEPSNDVSLPTSVTTLSSTWTGGAPTNGDTTACTTSGSVATGTSTCALDNVTLYGLSTGSAARDVRKDLTGNQSIITFIVQGNFDNTAASTTLEMSARNGGFQDHNGNFVPDLTGEWDEDGDGLPDNYFHSSDGNDLRAQLDAAIRAILRRATSGTAASIIGAGKGSGANLLQAFFYPAKDFVSGGTVVTLTWMGFIQNFWFEVDPLLRFTNIREDTDTDHSLAEAHDDIDVFQFDTTQAKTVINRFLDHNDDANSGNPDGFIDKNPPITGTLVTDTPAQVDIHEAPTLWEAGVNLFQRAASNRTIYTALPLSGSIVQGQCVNATSGSVSCQAFDTGNCTGIQPFLQASGCNSGQDAFNIISYVRGTDVSPIGGVNTRNRSLTLPLPLYANTLNISSTDTAGTWKLGDTINSTAKIQGAFKLNDYDKRYGDGTYTAYITPSTDPDLTKHSKSIPYDTGNAWIYSGANDGMLHAYYMGKLNANTTAPEIAALDDALSLGRGYEQWAYVPKNALPYVRYLSDKNYCHVYYVDLPSKVFDAAIEDVGVSGYSGQTRTKDSWRTIVIGGMGYGGGCGCTSGASDCVQSVQSSGTNIGLSSYFALDVTDPRTPKLLWEFSNVDLGYAFTSPAILRIGDTTHDGNWYVVIGSGPTGGINTAAHQFMGRSNQPAKIYILDLKDGSLQRTINLDTAIPSSGFNLSFVGSISDPFDIGPTPGPNWKDEVLYLSIVKKDTNTGLWNKGNIVRLYTKEDTNVNNWTVRQLLSTDVGPITTKVAGLNAKQRQEQWLYWGTGRYYFKLSNNSDDSANANNDNTHQRKLFGVKDPCFSASNQTIDPNCTSTVDPTQLTNVTTTAVANPNSVPGWFLNLCTQADQTNCPALDSTDQEERVISDTQTSSLGAVFFTTFQPSNDPCTFGGKTFIYALKFDSGATGAGYLFGQAIVQTSTGAIQEINLTSAFTQRNATGESLGRRSAAFIGQAPVESPLIVLSPPPIQRVLRLKEK